MIDESVMFFGQWDCDSFLPSEETKRSRGFGIDEVNDTFNFAYGFKTFVALHNFDTNATDFKRELDHNDCVILHTHATKNDGQ